MNQADDRTPAGTSARPRVAPDPRDDEQPPPLVGVIWALLVVNTLGTIGGESILPVPRTALQMITMGSLCAAFVLALVLNPRLRVRPNAFLFLLTLVLVVSVAASSSLDSGFGSLFRCARLAVLIATLWLISCWWDGGLTFVRYHHRAVGAVLGSVVLGLVLAPGAARPADFDGRLVGTLWPLTATQVGDYAAVFTGLTLILWMGRRISGRSALGMGVPAVVVLILTHTRTATVALAVAITVAALTLTLASARARQGLVAAAVSAGLIAAAFAAPLVGWFQRGQDEEALSNLTGRQKVWNLLLEAERTPKEQLLGVGLTDKSFAGRPIDNTWLTVYHEQGLVGVTLIVILLVGLVFAAVMRPPSPARACAVFLVVYCVLASYTQVVLGDATSYLLHVTVAATLLAGGAGPAVGARDAAATPDSTTRPPA